MLGQVLALKLGGILLLVWMLAIHLAWERVLYINHSSVFQFELELVMDLYLCTSICLLCLNCCYWSQLVKGHKLHQPLNRLMGPLDQQTACQLWL
uniref:Uncharacterized protein n=1 Tax=Picea glauca TaxID=3330 RepID=A0A101LYU8_PICGL|nr:hypothetical protein ABT39_MTgene4856 [Picea glauca]QHR88649.1 hypothetical protein Q903MT_gene2663 [Picea sitchensis]